MQLYQETLRRKKIIVQRAEKNFQNSKNPVDYQS